MPPRRGSGLLRAEGEGAVVVGDHGEGCAGFGEGVAGGMVLEVGGNCVEFCGEEAVEGVGPFAGGGFVCGGGKEGAGEVVIEAGGALAEFETVEDDEGGGGGAFEGGLDAGGVGGGGFGFLFGEEEFGGQQVHVFGGPGDGDALGEGGQGFFAGSALAEGRDFLVEGVVDADEDGVPIGGGGVDGAEDVEGVGELGEGGGVAGGDDLDFFEEAPAFVFVGDGGGGIDGREGVEGFLELSALVGGEDAGAGDGAEGLFGLHIQGDGGEGAEDAFVCDVSGEAFDGEEVAEGAGEIVGGGAACGAGAERGGDVAHGGEDGGGGGDETSLLAVEGCPPAGCIGGGLGEGEGVCGLLEEIDEMGEVAGVPEMEVGGLSFLVFARGGVVGEALPGEGGFVIEPGICGGLAAGHAGDGLSFALELVGGDDGEPAGEAVGVGGDAGGVPVVPGAEVIDGAVGVEGFGDDGGFGAEGEGRRGACGGGHDEGSLLRGRGEGGEEDEEQRADARRWHTGPLCLLRLYRVGGARGISPQRARRAQRNGVGEETDTQCALFPL